MNRIRDCSEATKHRIAVEIYDDRQKVRRGLEKLRSNGIITTEEHMNLSVTLADLEKYLSEKDEDVKKEVKTMGDKDYIPRSREAWCVGAGIC